MFWTNLGQNDIRRSDVADLAAAPVTLVSSQNVVIPAAKGSLLGWRMVVSFSTGTIIGVATTSTDYSFMYRSTDNGDTWSAAVMWVGSRAADGVSDPQSVGSRPLSAACFGEISMDGVAAIVYAEYAFSSIASQARRVWISKDDGLTWAVLWESSIDTGPLHRAHFHGLLTTADGQLILFAGDNNAEAAIIRGPGIQARWALLNDMTNSEIETFTQSNSDFAILRGLQEYRVINATQKGGYIYYGLDGGNTFGIYRLPVNFTAATPDGLTPVFTAGGRFTDLFINHAGAIVTSAGTILIIDYLEGGLANANEIRLNVSVNGQDWAQVAQVLLDTGKIPPALGASMDVYQLATGEIILGSNRAVFAMRGGPPEVPSISGARETAMLVESGDWTGSLEIIAPRAWV